MKYRMEWTLKDGTRVTDQLFTAETVSDMLMNLESWGATDITLESVDDTGK